jgi:hypothetical protein
MIGLRPVFVIGVVLAACGGEDSMDPFELRDLVEPIGEPCSTTAVNGDVVFTSKANSLVVGSIASVDLTVGIHLQLGWETVEYRIESSGACTGSTTGHTLGLHTFREELGPQTAPDQVSADTTNSALQPTGTVTFTGYNPAGPWLCGSFDLTYAGGARDIGTFRAVDHCGRLGFE